MHLHFLNTGSAIIQTSTIEAPKAHETLFLIMYCFVLQIPPEMPGKEHPECGLELLTHQKSYE